MFNKRADTREDRRQLLDRARREREERQSTNVRLAAASVIQRAYRLHSTRLRLAKAVRVAFDVSVRQPTGTFQ
jgi:acetyl-CoA carboxylase carboxyltransferase component